MPVVGVLEGDRRSDRLMRVVAGPARIFHLAGRHDAGLRRHPPALHTANGRRALRLVVRGGCPRALRGGRVPAAGGGEVVGRRVPRAWVVALGASAVLPGFTAAHAHVVYYGFTRSAAALWGVRDGADGLGRLKDNAKSLKPGE